MRPVVRLEARIVQLRVGRARRDGRLQRRLDGPWPRRLATISVGYADGYPRAASEHRPVQGDAGAAIVAGRRCPFAGRVSMDLDHHRRDRASRRTRSGAAIPSPHRRRSDRRRGRRAGRHHRLRDPDRPGPALSPASIAGAWPDGEASTKPSSARAAARSTTAGRASARPAAAGTRSSRRAGGSLPRWRARPRRGPPAPRAGSFPSRASPARPRKRPARLPASPSSTGSPAAASCAAR